MIGDYEIIPKHTDGVTKTPDLRPRYLSLDASTEADKEENEALNRERDSRALCRELL
jgi:hypothetical protein